MNLKSNQRGFVLIEFAIALPLLILLLYTLGSVNLKIWDIAKKQVADYVLETEAQEIIDRITTDARAAYSVEVEKASSLGDFETVNFVCHTNSVGKNDSGFYDTFSQRIYTVDNADGKNFHVYFKRNTGDAHNNPLTGDNSYGDTVVRQLTFSKPAEKVLHVTIKLESLVTGQRVKFNTAVYMPACEEFKI